MSGVACGHYNDQPKRPINQQRPMTSTLGYCCVEYLMQWLTVTPPIPCNDISTSSGDLDLGRIVPPDVEILVGCSLLRRIEFVTVRIHTPRCHPGSIESIKIPKANVTGRLYTAFTDNRPPCRSGYISQDYEWH